MTVLLPALDAGLVERGRVGRLCLLAALAGEHALLIGPPGTAKSELARRLHLLFRGARYFERLLTRFSVPEELFGPLSIRALEQDRYERHTAGFLPEAHIAFIDEVFKANSAILNALLTLLNEREFDNGAGRQRCPLISVIGATNSVPEDEVAEAFFDRFLMRLQVQPVSAEGFVRLLQLDPATPWHDPPLGLRVSAREITALQRAASSVALPEDVAQVLAALHAHLAQEGVTVSDRRWVKIVWLLRIVAASEGRSAVAVWDLLLLPWCTAPDAAGQARVLQWLQTRLGVHDAWSPPRLMRIVQAFEAQLLVEQQANDLDYDETGRLRFSSTELAAEVGDAKGGAAAPRMTASRRRRYGPLHIAARTRQIDELIWRIDGYAQELVCVERDLETYGRAALWLDAEQLQAAQSNLQATGAIIAQLHARALQARAGFAGLPRLPLGAAADVEPAPVQHEPLVDA
ncbi:MAG: AAA family ATPase [Betaproteobacteria bacterium]|nr:AAA family ATPase [Betaproteobacteria bacterium]